MSGFEPLASFREPFCIFPASCGADVSLNQHSNSLYIRHYQSEPRTLRDVSEQSFFWGETADQ